MTEEELERKAGMYEMNICGIHSNSKLRKAYKDGYKEGSRTESELIFKTWCKDQLSPCGFLLEHEAKISELKNSIEKMKKKIIGLIHNDENCLYKIIELLDDWETDE